MPRTKKSEESRKQAASTPAGARSVIWLNGSIAPGWKLAKPLQVHLELDEDGEHLATDTFSTVYGNGETEEKAVRDYCESLIHYFEILEDHATGNLQNTLLLRSLRHHLTKATSDRSDAPQAQRHRKSS